MRYSCDFQHRDTGERKNILVTLSAAEIRCVKAQPGDGELIAESMALHRAHKKLSNGWFHTKPPEVVLLS